MGYLEEGGGTQRSQRMDWMILSKLVSFRSLRLKVLQASSLVFADKIIIR